MTRIRVMLVEDHQVLREDLRRMLELEPDLLVVGEASSGQKAVDMAKALTPEVVLMDIKMSGMDGLQAIRLITQENPKIKVIILSMYEEYLLLAVQSGAAGYLLKDLQRGKLVQAIRDVREGRSPLRLSLSQEQLASIVKGSYGLDLLSQRERGVLQLMANGKTNHEIAGLIGVSESTVKRTIRQVSKKLGARNRSEMTAEATRRRLIQSVSIRRLPGPSPGGP